MIVNSFNYNVKSNIYTPFFDGRKSKFDKKKDSATHCAYCGLKFIYRRQMHIDHIVPVSAFSSFEEADTDDNTWVLCGTCNHAKGGMSLDDFKRKYPRLEEAYLNESPSMSLAFTARPVFRTTPQQRRELVCYLPAITR